MKNLIAWFKDEEGQGMVEYGLLIGLIAIVVIVALIAIGPRIRDLFMNADDHLDAVKTVTVAT